MKTDIILSGVGGQGVLTAATILAEAARRAGFHVKQGEIHGMSQRGGAVVANVRISDTPVPGDLVPLGEAAMILSLEPVEALRQVEYLSPDGILVTSSSPVRNVPDYPDLDDVLNAIAQLPRSLVVDAAALAREAGSGRADNVVMLGAASDFLPVPPEDLADVVDAFFAPKGEKVVSLNRRAFALGREAAAPALS